LDEVAHYRHLPKLESAVSLQGAAGNPIIMGFQEISQLKYHYGEMWPTLVSQAYTQIVLRTSEEASAKHAAGLLGQAEVERIRETKSVQGWGKTTYSYAKERLMQYVVTPGQIQSLEDLHFYMAQAGRVVKAVAKWRDPVIRAPRLLPRTIQPAPIIERKAEEQKPRSRYTQRKLPLESPANVT
jgi:type IV secretory pathway TraG/TraD family ATPase VirD4